MELDPIKRRYDSGEFQVCALAGAIICAIAIRNMAAGAVATCFISSAYTISRTLRGMGRANLMHPGRETSEIRVLGVAVAYVLALFACGLSAAIAIGSITGAGSVFIICRGILKMAEKKLIMRQNIGAV